jgi:DNA-binding transcriptional ArsR family regulator
MKEALNWALYRSNAHRGARLVLTCLADNSNERGMVALPVNILAAMTNLSRQAVYGAIERLLESGDLVEATRQGRSVTYRLGCFNEAGVFIGAEKKEAA